MKSNAKARNKLDAALLVHYPLSEPYGDSPDVLLFPWQRLSGRRGLNQRDLAESNAKSYEVSP